MNFVVKELIRVARYVSYGHGVGDIVWWFNGAKLHTHVSKGGFDDMHTKLMPKQGLNTDREWRGRFDVGRKVLSIEPPLGPFFSGDKDPPNSVMNKLFAAFNPSSIVMDTKRGLKKVACLKSKED